MEEFFVMLKNVLIFIALAIPGYILVKTKILSAKDSSVLSKLLLYIGVPFLILSSTIDIKFHRQSIEQILITAVIVLIGLISSFFISKPLSKIEKEKQQQGVTRFSYVFPNNGFIGIPLAMALFSEVNSLIVSLVVVANIITNEMIIIIGSYAISGDRKHISFKGILTNSVLIAFVIGIIVNLTNVCEYVPEISTYSQHLKGLVVPISMTIIGMKFAEIDIKGLFINKKLYFVSFIRLIVFPMTIVAVLILFKTFLPIHHDIIIAIFIAFSMPIAALAPTFADKFNIDSTKSVVYVLGTTLFSVITIPLLYTLLNMIIY